MSRRSMPSRNGNVLAIGFQVTCAALVTACIGSEMPETGSPTKRSEGNGPPVVTSAIILDAPLSQATPVAVQIQSEDPEREAVSFQYQWHVDNAPLAGQTKATLPAELLRRGQTVFVEIIPTDGTHKGQPYRTKSVVVGNTAPRVTAVLLTPQAARTGDKLAAQVESSDPDHDRVDLTYKWYRNDAIVKDGGEPFLDTIGFSAHDRIAVEVTAQDPTVSGNSLKSELLELSNSAPKILSMPPTSVAEDQFDYQVKAIDPDGDRLTYHLETAPPGMTISTETGLIAWQIQPDQQGTYHVRLAAKDGQGGMAFQEFDLTLTSTGHPKSPGA